MVSCPRKELVREGEIATYHTWSRCVQQLMLCGLDFLTGRDFSYRRAWLELLLEYLAGVFAIDVGNYTILSNHIHAILRTRPDIVRKMSDEEVAWRWKRAWPRWENGQWIREPTDREIAELLADPGKMEDARKGLSSLSWFMARWKEPIARMANEEARTKGHFWDGRYGCREILDDAGLLTCMLYVDANQVRAGMATSLEMSQHSGIALRLAQWHQEAANGTVQGYCSENWQDHGLELIEMERLFANCWLTPISGDGPLKTDEARAASDMQRPASGSQENESGDMDSETGDVGGGVGDQTPLDDLPVEEAPAAQEQVGDVPGDDQRDARTWAEAELVAGAGRPVEDESAYVERSETVHAVSRDRDERAKRAGAADGSGESLRSAAEPGDMVQPQLIRLLPNGERSNGTHVVLTRGTPSVLEHHGREQESAGERTGNHTCPAANRVTTEYCDLASAHTRDGSRPSAHGGAGPGGQRPAGHCGPTLSHDAPELPPPEAGEDQQASGETQASLPDRQIHQRLMARCTRRRASDNPILAMPLAQYLRIAQWVVDNVTSNVPSPTTDVPLTPSDEPSSDVNGSPPNEVPPWLKPVARQLGLNPDGWMEAMRQFESWFGRAIGATPALQAMLERTGKRRILGFRNCQTAFG